VKVYHPFISEDVNVTSPPHPPGTTYRVSIGIEYWDGMPVEVEKVQMVYNGTVSGRRSPSYPIGTDDFDRVQVARCRLLEKARKMPMTPDRLRAFTPDSHAAKAMQQEKVASHVDAIMSQLTRK